MKFRMDIGALRALAVIAVVLFHFKVPFFESGLIGVDIFFVISGYLMTSIILTGFKKSNFSLLEFYKKRAKRIVPALLVLILTLLVTTYSLFLPKDYQELSTYSLYSSLFVSNIYFFFKSNYFNPVSDFNALLHTWSLAVEWQFYLLYPLLLLPLKKLYLNKKNTFNIIFISFTVADFLFMSYFCNAHRNFSFYMFPTRAWEMTAGGIAFLLTDSKITHLKKQLSTFIVTLSYLCLLASITLLSKLSPFWPSPYTAIPVLATFLIVLFNQENLVIKNRIVQFFGKTSYSIYLYHWPIYVISLYLGWITPVATLFLIVLSFALGYLSFAFIESNRLFSSFKIVNVFWAIVISLAFSGTKYKFNMPIWKQYPDVLSIAAASSDSRYEIKSDCFLTSKNTFADYNKMDCLKVDSTRSNVLLFGDSHALEYYFPLKKIYATKGINLIAAAAAGTTPLLTYKGNPEMTKLVKYIFEDFVPKNQKHISLVILSTHWAAQYKDGSLDELGNELNKVILFFKEKGIQVKILGQTESYIIPYAKIAALNYKRTINNDELFVNKRGLEINNFLVQHIPDSQYINLYNLKFKKLEGTTPYIYDKDHFTDIGIRQVTDYLSENKLLDIK